MTTSNFRFTLATALVLATGCGVEPDLGPDPTPDPIIFERARDQVEGPFGGAFGGDGVTVRYRVAFLPDEMMHVTVTTSDGFTLVDSTFDHGIETTTIVGEHHVGTNAPALDRDALAELAAIPEMQLLPELRDSILCPVISISPKRVTAWTWADQLEPR